MQIPSSFKLLGRTIVVKEDAQLMQDRDWCGSADYQKDVITLLPKSAHYNASNAKLEQTFCHELVHAILFTMGKTNHDEEFTDAFGSLLHQFERTKA